MDTLARRRGALLLAGLHEAVGDGMMTEFMTGFVVRYAGQAVTTRDFAVYAREHLDKDAWRLVAAGLGGEGALLLDHVHRSESAGSGRRKA
jgi:hypothetical protein